MESTRRLSQQTKERLLRLDRMDWELLKLHAMTLAELRPTWTAAVMSLGNEELLEKVLERVEMAISVRRRWEAAGLDPSAAREAAALSLQVEPEDEELERELDDPIEVLDPRVAEAMGIRYASEEDSIEEDLTRQQALDSLMISHPEAVSKLIERVARWAGWVESVEEALRDGGKERTTGSARET